MPFQCFSRYLCLGSFTHYSVFPHIDEHLNNVKTKFDTTLMQLCKLKFFL